MLSYESLAGATGARMFYKPERFAARDAFKGRLPALAIDDIPAVLEEIGMTELVAFVRAPAASGLVGGREVVVSMMLDGDVLEEAEAIVASTERSALGHRVVLEVSRGYLDVRRLQERHRTLVLRQEIDYALERSTGSVPADYRLLCTETIDLLRNLNLTLDRFEAVRPTPDAEAEMFQLCEDRVVPRWREIWYRANALVAPLMDDDEARAAAKRFTERLLTPHFMAGAFCRRSYEKPLGYPGDFQIMNMVYDWQREGRSLFEKMVHRLGLEAGLCVATRLNVVRRAIADALSGTDPGVVRIASLGCGPAREVRDFLAAFQVLPRPVTFTLIDQDQAALAEIYERTLPSVLRVAGRATVDCLNASFVQLMKAGALFGKLPPQDLIYSVGLIDYLNDRRCSALIASLFEHLKPGGRLVIGNMLDAPSGTLWPMEFITDWSIIYRTERQMLGLAAELPGEAWTELDSSGRAVLLHLRKP